MNNALFEIGALLKGTTVRTEKFEYFHKGITILRELYDMGVLTLKEYGTSSRQMFLDYMEGE